MPILVGTDGVRRMGKSLGNYIGVAEPTRTTMFGKVMSIPDEPMRQYFTLLTDLPLAEVDRLLGPGVNPRDAKEVLGKAIVAQYHGRGGRRAAAAEFRRRSAAARTPTRSPRWPIAARPARRRGPDRRAPPDRRPRAGDEHLERPPGDRAGGRHDRPRPDGRHRPQGA